MPAWSQNGELEQLYDDLAAAGPQEYQQIEQKIWSAWSRSGSSAMDLLLQRGRDALEADDWQTAIEHLTALTDHAPDFAEGFNARATAYFRAGLYGPALQDIQIALALNPRHFGALSGFALILEELGYHQDALAAYKAVLAIHPNRPDVKEAIKRLEQELGGAKL